MPPGKQILKALGFRVYVMTMMIPHIGYPIQFTKQIIRKLTRSPVDDSMYQEGLIGIHDGLRDALPFEVSFLHV